MMDLINNNLVVLNYEAENQEQIIDKLVDVLDSDGRLCDKNTYKYDVYLRENEISTSMGMHIAIPHARSKGVLYPSLVFIRLKNPVIWNDDSVSMVLGIAVPDDRESDKGDYLSILSKLARKLLNDDFRDALKTTDTSDNCVKLLSIA